jgi:capsular exopolysaccharide synthesis family protein
MSRIQQILEKAERDGLRRVPHGAGVAIAPAPSDPMPAIAGDRVQMDGRRPSVPIRTISGTRLHGLLRTTLSGNAVAAEQYRAMRTRILHNDVGSPVSVVLVTSPGRREGKSLTVANLGLAMAQEYQRSICIVDADLRSPQQQRLFGLPDGPGLSEVLAGQSMLEDAMVALEDYRIVIVPAGHAGAHPAELLGATSMRRTIDTLRTRFDHVVIDAPAATPLADVGILTPLVDSVLLVVRAGTTSKPAIHDAIAAMDRAKLLGIVLNEAA